MHTDMCKLAKHRPSSASNRTMAMLDTFMNMFKLSQRNDAVADAGASVTAGQYIKTWNSNGKVDVNNYSAPQQPTTSKREQPDSSVQEPISIKKGKKEFSFAPQLKPSVSTEKSRISAEDQRTLAPLYHVKISSNHASTTPPDLIDAYQHNIENQARNESLRKRPKAYAFLKSALEQPLAELRRFLWTNGSDKDDGDGENSDKDDDEAKAIELIRVILTDFTLVCEKPPYPRGTNERTPFMESLVPLFKAYSAIYGNVSFIWGEKSLSICVPDASKLMDGIGNCTLDNVDRILVESSGPKDGSHTDDDTLKLIEYVSLSMRNEMKQLEQASRATFEKRRIFALHMVGYRLTLWSAFIHHHHWACLQERTAVIPSTWATRKHWLQCFELIFCLAVRDMHELTMNESLTNY
ncbi:hypothetical protein DM01DRAFT_1323476 [Hesseltinella vesiculosa]|uniref:Uncharacterized protein n=1 Tax=Hesseltinella vesiculosa TaxID=101127 RepID=A0A1X2GF14_9FUNG|nr:hypothetical protein DM01DRAFT_1323476 [Hesseltinella vesiculosa]